MGNRYKPGQMVYIRATVSNQPSSYEVHVTLPCNGYRINPKNVNDSVFYMNETDVIDLDKVAAVQRKKGQDEAWSLAEDISDDNTISTENLARVFNRDRRHDVLRDYTYEDTAKRFRAWRENTLPDVGDIVECEGIDMLAVITNIDDSYTLLFSDGTTGYADVDDIIKTGRKVDMDSILAKLF